MPPVATNIDSLIANEFSVELDGEEVTGIFGVSGLVSFQLGEDGQRVWPAFTVSKMVQRDPQGAFNKWLQETQSGSKPTRDLSIVAVDDGVATRRWTAKNAYIQSVHYSDFNEASFEMVAELVEIGYESMTEEFLLNE
ncbi:phage tail protein [Phototrophicus methaneseepsis]|uniref:Phage tail protein n=1 Tax=Phototrophicus methaneseepsis TaxID=2710758 RepID=A0A7S8IGS8_9CHLR|nr:phage tail protein [Phototrophicus methaneseepsis]QPC84418.1 phage tail protein [Phototrophicus methaneseepsis]